MPTGALADEMQKGGQRGNLKISRKWRWREGEREGGRKGGREGELVIHSFAAGNIH